MSDQSLTVVGIPLSSAGISFSGRGDNNLGLNKIHRTTYGVKILTGFAICAIAPSLYTNVSIAI
jgi:hypothetical protein